MKINNPVITGDIVVDLMNELPNYDTFRNLAGKYGFTGSPFLSIRKYVNSLPYKTMIELYKETKSILKQQGEVI